MIGAALAAAFGAPLVGLTSVVLGLDWVLGWSLFGAIVGAMGGAIAIRWYRAGRRRAWVALAVLIYAVAVLSIPVLGSIIELEFPGHARMQLATLSRDLQLYVIAPMGFIVAAPFAPAAVACALLWRAALRTLDRRAAPDAQTPASSLDPGDDAQFDRGLMVGVIVIAVFAIGMFALVVNGLSHVGI
jgi:hypothetical protein